ncbi:hypothetical protein L209DRAFT_742848 [Thermothelomyces heterothallicus CBS 203.75]
MRTEVLDLSDGQGEATSVQIEYFPDTRRSLGNEDEDVDISSGSSVVSGLVFSPPAVQCLVAASPLVAVGTLDDEGRPWTSIWGGERGFARPVAQDILGVQSLVDTAHDPVIQALMGEAAEREVVRPEGGRTVRALTIDLEARDRVKLAGKMVVNTVAGRPDNNPVGEVQLAMQVQESLGNCPKYLNKKTIGAHVPSRQRVSPSMPLPPEAVAVIEQADMLFLPSTNGQNHGHQPPWRACGFHPRRRQLGRQRRPGLPGILRQPPLPNT